MISTRHALNPQAQAISGIASRYETPVSAFNTQPAMPTAASTSGSTRQPSKAPSSLSAMSSGVMGPEKETAVSNLVSMSLDGLRNGVGGIANNVAAPIGAFEKGVTRDIASSLVSGGLSRGLIGGGIAALMGVPTEALPEVAVRSVVGSPTTAMKGILDAATSGYAANRVQGAYSDPRMDEGLYSDISEMAGPESIEDPTEAYSPQDMQDWDTTRQMFEAHEDLMGGWVGRVPVVGPLAKPFSVAFRDVRPQTMTALVGEDFGKKRDAAVDAELDASGVFANERDFRNAGIDAALDETGVFGSERAYRDRLNSQIDSALEDSGVFGIERGIRERDAISGGMNRGFGDFTEAGRPLGGQVGSLDPTFERELYDRYNATFGGVFGESSGASTGDPAMDAAIDAELDKELGGVFDAYDSARGAGGGMGSSAGVGGSAY